MVNNKAAKVKFNEFDINVLQDQSVNGINHKIILSDAYQDASF